MLLGNYLEEVCATITLNNGGAELTLLNSGNSTTQSGLAGTSSLYEDRSREGNLTNAVNNSERARWHQQPVRRQEQRR